MDGANNERIKLKKRFGFISRESRERKNAHLYMDGDLEVRCTALYKWGRRCMAFISSWMEI